MTNDQINAIADKFAVRLVEEPSPTHPDKLCLSGSLQCRYFIERDMDGSELDKQTARRKLLSTIARALVNHGNAMLDEIRHRS